MSLKVEKGPVGWLYPRDHVSRSTGICSRLHMVYVHKLWWLQHPRGRGSSGPAIVLCVLLLVNRHWEADDYFVFLVVE